MKQAAVQPLLAIIVPAHNEAGNIARTLHSLKKSTSSTVIVVADNCDDATAEVASACGARVLIRKDRSQRGKPYALDYALKILHSEGFAYFAFVDADTVVEENFASVLLSAFANGSQAIQVAYAQFGYDKSHMQRLLDIGFSASNSIRPMGRSYWNLSCGILGNGFALTRETLLAVPFQVDSIVEDLVYHIHLVGKGKKVDFVSCTTVWAEIAGSAKAVSIQRSRWEGGRLMALIRQGPRLLKLALGGQMRLIEPLLDLLCPPISFHVLAILLLFLFPFPVVHAYAWIALGIVFAYCMTAISVRKEVIKDCTALCLAPAYLLWKLLMLPKIISSACKAKWLRTAREKKLK